jgi:small acid-soluble spore protein D (minor alpha/beta-type SASP)
MANKKLVPEAKQALSNMKYEVATSLNVKFNPGYNGDLTSRQAGSVGGEMVKRMIQQYEQGLSGHTATTIPRR